jgi:hypothetical protein
MKKLEKLTVRITHTNGWYKKDEIHEVNNYVTFDFHGRDANFEKNKGTYGISLNHCVVLNKDAIENRELLLDFLKCYNNGEVTEWGIKDVDEYLKNK